MQQTNQIKYCRAKFQFCSVLIWIVLQITFNAPNWEWTRNYYNRGLSDLILVVNWIIKNKCWLCIQRCSANLQWNLPWRGYLYWKKCGSFFTKKGKFGSFFLNTPLISKTTVNTVVTITMATITSKPFYRWHDYRAWDCRLHTTLHYTVVFKSFYFIV